MNGFIIMSLEHLKSFLRRKWATGRRPGLPVEADLTAEESRDAITRFLFVEHPPQPVDLCFVLGCPTPNSMDPAIALHARGWAPRIMISGHGPQQQAEPEALQFRNYAMARGVPEAVMMLETEATNTMENFTFSAPIIAREIGWDRIRDVALVCKPFHARRALMTARQHWPAHLRFIVQPGQRPDDPPASTWWETEGGRAFVLRELVAIGTYAQKGDIRCF